MKKLLCLMLALAMFATMSVTAFANSYTTTVTYDITDGNAIVKTTGTAVAGSEVTQILYTGADYETGDILYIDQTTAATDGSFGLTYKVKGDAIKDLDAMTSIVGTDDGVINFAETADNVGDIELAKAVTITVVNEDLYKDITVSLAGNTDTSVTIARGTQKKVVITSGAELAFNVGTTNYEYTIAGAAETAGATFNKAFAADTTIAFSTKTVAIDMASWIAGTGAYGDVMVWDVVASLADFAAGEGSYVSGDEGLLDDVTEVAKELSVLSKISNANTGDIEYGIMFVVGSVGELNENTAKVKILNSLGATDGVWAIKAIDKVGETLTTNATVCTYVKYNDTYRCGDPIVVNYAN